MTPTISERASASITPRAVEMKLAERPLSEEYRLVALKWVDAQAAADILEETKTSVFAEKCMQQGDIAVNKAEMRVKASPEWREHLERIVSARRDANKLKMQLRYIEMRHREWVSANATSREEMRMR